MRKHLKFFLIVSLMLTILTSCEALKPKKVDTRETSIKGSERSRKNIEEGGGVSLKNVLNRRGGSFEKNVEQTLSLVHLIQCGELR